MLGTGVSPDIAVDAAGTAHIVWDEEGTIGSTPDVLRLRLERERARAPSLTP